MDEIINALSQIEFALKPSIFDYLTLVIAVMGLYISLNTIKKENRIRTIESIPVLLIDEETLVSDFLKYEAKNPDLLPFELDVINFSKASAYDIEISLNPNFHELERKGLLKKKDLKSYEENHSYSNNVIYLSESQNYFMQTETKLEGRIFYKDLTFKRKAIVGNGKVKISTTELMNFNELIESYFCFVELQNKNFSLPFSIKINYYDLSGNAYSSEYKLRLSLSGGSFIPINKNEFKYQQINYQVENLSVDSSALNHKNKL